MMASAIGVMDDELATELYFVQFGLHVNYARANESGLSFLTHMITHHIGHRIVFIIDSTFEFRQFKLILFCSPL